MRPNCSGKTLAKRAPPPPSFSKRTPHFQQAAHRFSRPLPGSRTAQKRRISSGLPDRLRRWLGFTRCQASPARSRSHNVAGERRDPRRGLFALETTVHAALEPVCWRQPSARTGAPLGSGRRDGALDVVESLVKRVGASAISSARSALSPWCRRRSRSG